MDIHLLGVGSVGALFAFHLRRALANAHQTGKVVLHLHRKPATDKPKIIIESNDGRQETQDGFEVDAEASTSPIDVLVVSLKADLTLQALRPLVPRLQHTRPSTLVLLQNGVGQDEAIRNQLFSNARGQEPYILLGSNTHGTWRKAPLHTVHAARGALHIGLAADSRIDAATERALLAGNAQEQDPLATLSYTLRTLALLRDPLALELEASGPFRVRALRKLVANCALNGLSALAECQNGAVLTRPDTRDEVPAIVRECADVLAHRFPEDVAREPGLTHHSLLENARHVMTLTAENWSSMVQDMRSARGSTEIDFFNGTIVRWAADSGIPVPHNERLLERVREKARAVAANRASSARSGG